MLLSHLVSPEAVKSFGAGVTMLRKWQQNFHRVRELQAALPDSSLLLKGVDQASAHLLSLYPLIGFRVNAFRNRVSLDYNPSVATVLQLVRLLQAEFEAAALTLDGLSPEKKARAAAALAHEQALTAKGVPPKASAGLGLEAQVKALEGSKGEGKGKGKDKGSEATREVGLCHHFSDGKGCRYGDSCRSKHDRAAARKQKRCLACGQEGHYRPDCTLVAPENRTTLDSTRPFDPKAAPPKRNVVAKAKSGSVSQAKGIMEDPGSSVPPEASTAKAGGSAQEVLIAEAAKLLKGVSLKPISLVEMVDEGQDLSRFACLSELGIDESWLRAAVVNAADQLFALVDSGATNALRPAKEGELARARVIKVDLASGGTELHVNCWGTLLSASPCQVIVPAGYLVQLGFGLTWRKKGCVIRRKGEASLPVTVVKGCPLIPREVGLRLLDEYESLRDCGEIPGVKKTVEPLPCEVPSGGG